MVLLFLVATTVFVVQKEPSKTETKQAVLPIDGVPLATNRGLYPGDNVYTPSTARFATPRLLILIPCNWPRDRDRVEAVEATWATHLEPFRDKYIFVVTLGSEELPTPAEMVRLDGTPRFLLLPARMPDTHSSFNIWDKVSRMFIHAGEQWLEQFDFFLKQDSDAWLGVENLRVYLSFFDPSRPWYMGSTCLYRWQNQGISFALGQSEVLSRGALARVLPALQNMSTVCRCDICCCKQRIDISDHDHPEILNGNWATHKNEDAHMGACLNAVGIVPTNTLDANGRRRFHEFKLEDHSGLTFPPIAKRSDDFVFAMQPSTLRLGADCSQEYVINVHPFKRDILQGFQRLEELYHTKQIGTPRINMPPDTGPFHYDPDQLNFRFDRITRLPKSLEVRARWARDHAQNISAKWQQRDQRKYP